MHNHKVSGFLSADLEIILRGKSFADTLNKSCPFFLSFWIIQFNKKIELIIALIMSINYKPKHLINLLTYNYGRTK